MPEFIDKIRKRVESGVTIAGVKSRNLLEITKLQGQISALQDRKRTYLAELGDHYYKGFAAVKLSDDRTQHILHGVCQAIAEIDRQVLEKEQEIRQLQEVEWGLASRMHSQICQCGAELAPGVLFCSHCGIRVEDMLRARSSCRDAWRTCKCGHVLADGAVFCGNCGLRVEESIIEPGPSLLCACGHVLEEGVVFCGSCGTKVAERTAAREQ